MAQYNFGGNSIDFDYNEIKEQFNRLINNSIKESLEDLYKDGASHKQVVQEANKIIKEAFDKTQASNVLDYYQKINEQIKKLEENIEKSTDETEIEKFRESINKLKDEARNVTDAFNSIDEHSGFKKIKKSIDDIEEPIKNIASSFRNIDSTIMNTLSTWSKADEAASNYIKTLGGTKAAYDKLRKDTISNVVNSDIAIKYNMDPAELIKAQEDYVNGIGRSINITNSQQDTLGAISKVMGESGKELSVMLEQFGLGLNDAGKHATRIFKEATSEGISASKLSSTIAKNLSMAQKYTFKDGVEGLEKMAKKAIETSLSMEAIAGFADKLTSIEGGGVEGAIDVAARLQVLGGSFASMANPITLLNKGLNDVEGLQDSIKNMVKGLSQFDKLTGQVKTSAYNRQRLKAASQATGISYEELIKSSQRHAMRGEIEAQLKSATNLNKSDKNYEKFAELLKNTATFENGKAGVSINGNFTELKDLKNEDYKTILQETQDERSDIKQIAMDLRSLKDAREGLGKQVGSYMANILGFLGDFMKSVTIGLGSIAGILAVGKLIGGVGNIGKNIVSIFGNSKDLFKNIGKIFGNYKIGNPLNQSVNNLVGNGATGNVTNSIIKGFSNFGKKILGKITSRTINIAGKKVVEEAISRTPGTIMKGGIKRSANRLALKTIGRAGLGTVVKGASPFAIAGALGNIGTDYLVDKGKIQKGGAAHTSLKAISTAAEWGATGAMLGSFLGGPIGTLIGGGIGAVAGGVKSIYDASKSKNTEIVDKQLQKLGIERKGDYSNSQLKDIDKALQNGNISDSVRQKLIQNGDDAILDEIKKVKNNNKEKSESINKNNFDKGYFQIKEAFFNGFNNNFSEIKNISGKAETGYYQEKVSKSESIRRGLGGNLNKENNKIDVNITGEIKLTSNDGLMIDITKYLLKDPKFTQNISKLIVNQINYNKLAVNIPNKDLVK